MRTGFCEPKPTQIPALTGLRFVAAMLVLLAHGYPSLSFGNNYTLIYVFHPLAELGMTIFFVLSGFVMWINYAHLFRTQPFSRALWTFASARFARLYPMFLFILLLALALCPTPQMRQAFTALPLYLVMMQAWILGWNGHLFLFSIPEIGHTWSISVEAFLYACFPTLVLGSVFIRSVRAVTFWLAIAVVSFIIFMALLLEHQSVASVVAHGVPKKDGLSWLTYYSPYPRVFQFAVGCLLAMICVARRGRAVSKFEASLAALSAIGAVTILASSHYLTAKIAIEANSDHFDLPAIIYVRGATFVFAAWLVFYVCSYKGALNQGLSSRPAVAGGEISYSIYLLHPFIIKWFIRPPQSDLTPMALLHFIFILSAIVVITLVFSAGTYHVIESPARRWLRRVAAGVRPKPDEVGWRAGWLWLTIKMTARKPSRSSMITRATHDD